MAPRSVLRGLIAPLFAAAVLVLAATPSSAGAAPRHCVIDLDSGVRSCHGSVSAAVAGIQAYSLITLYDWVDLDARGGSLTFTGSRQCSATTADKDHRYPSLVPYDMNDKVSSVRTFAGCSVWFSSDINYEGECGNRWTDMSANLGDQDCDNRASSMELS